MSIGDIKTPMFAIACETDHIADWKSSFDGVKKFASRSKTFVLAESGHIAGIVNPPTKKKYGHYTSDAGWSDADHWLAGAVKHEGSWWGRWDAWLSKKSGALVDARQPGTGDFPVLAAAPGSYVQRRGKSSD